MKINKIISNPKSISLNFQKKTGIVKYPKKVLNAEWPDEWIEINHKGYPRFSRVPLIENGSLGSVTLQKALIERSSKRNFDDKYQFSLRELSNLLYFSSGIKKTNDDEKEERFYPSAGARYSLEIYPVILNVKGFEQGIYHYHLKSNSLEVISLGKDVVKNTLKSFDQSWLNKSNLVILITSVYWRTQVKYGERGYRYIYLDAGHLCQNFYLTSEALNLGCCEIGGFLDKKINKILDLDENNEATIVALGIGKYKKGK
jgi:SagB-type dehydrogenase family enzyme